MTLFVPTVIVLPVAAADIDERDEHLGLLRTLGPVAPRQEYTDRVWHAFVDVTERWRADRTLYLIVGRRRYGQRMPWTVQRQTTCTVARANIERLGCECCWRETPPAVRRLVLRDLGLAQ